MISVEDAKALVLKHSVPLSVKQLPLKESLNFYLAEDVAAKIDLPPFRQSAMDGYAVNYKTNDEINCIGEISAGSSTLFQLKPNEAVRIFTGAAVPQDANLIIMQEWIDAGSTSYPHFINLKSGYLPKIGDHIRPKAEQISMNSTALEKGSLLNSAALSYLQSFGYQSLSVIDKPSVSIIITGDELIEPGKELLHGQIYESNSVSIQSSIESSGFKVNNTHKCKDNLKSTIEQITKALELSNLVILSGGISVGEYDFVLRALQDIGVDEVFYKVKQKPGKPIFFGTKDSKAVFALPGNPAAALSCIYEYVIPHLKLRSGASNPWPTTIKMPLNSDYFKKGDRAQFLKAFAHGKEVSLFGHQASSMLSSFTQANCLVYLPANKEKIKRGDLVEVHLI